MELEREQSCPEEESLLAYGLGLADEETAGSVEHHLEHCDACLSALALARQRLRQLESAGGIAVPPHIVEQVAATPHRAAATAVADAPAATLARRVRLPLPPRPVLSWALAAGVLLVVGVQIGSWQVTRAPERRTRAVVVEQPIRVSAATALVRREPHPQAEVVATLRRGDAVTVGSEEREWYRVSLPDGTEGWVEQDAFR
ncbi:MAG: SH3 domain-containing protein [Candidatus Binatia bacterium]|nr:SH3 domain-containing protein [Candidatus Binatia bacterium]